LRIELIAFESLGVRSMATLVETRDALILIDPSAALAPRRFGLPPHIREVERLLQLFDRIAELVKDADLVVVTHYHYDHHDPGKFMDPEVYRGKRMWIKNPRSRINVSQRIRAHRFLKILEPRVDELRFADGSSTTLGRTRILFSEPVPHGESDRLGYVVAVCIDDGEERLLYTSDIEGGPLDQHLQLFKWCSPTIAIVDGPPTYLAGYKYSMKSLESSINNLVEALKMPQLHTMVLDHHAARELDHAKKLNRLVEAARELGKRVQLASQFMGVEAQLLEALRRELFEQDPRDGLELLKSRKRGGEDLELGE